MSEKQDGDYIDGQLIVTFKTNITDEKAREFCLSNGTEVLNAMRFIFTYVVGIVDGSSVEDKIRLFQSLPQVASANFNRVVKGHLKC